MYAIGMEFFLNQAHAGWKPVRTWFLEIAFVRKVGVCVSAPKGINNYSREMNP